MALVIDRLRAACTFALAVPALAAAGCSGQEPGGAGTANPAPAPAKIAECPADLEAGWQKLADRIEAPVYCPSWLPDPLTGELGGEWHATDSVKRDGSYLMGFIWYERAAAEVHVNLRAYPGRTEIPTCNGRPCFSDSQGTKHVGDFDVEVFTVNRGADTWHVLYAWERDGSLYTVSQHVVPELGLPYGRVVANLDRIVKGLELVEPAQS